MRRLAVLLALVCIAGSVEAIAVTERSPMRHVRSTQERIENLLDVGARRSPTFVRLRQTLEAADVIVYVQAVLDLPPGLHGRLVFLRAAGGQRYLRIEVRHNLPIPELLATIAHEMQHAVEVAGASEVHDSQSLASYYRRVGIDHLAEGRFDTAAARLAGSRVRAELL